jgi:hypothetical protein
MEIHGQSWIPTSRRYRFVSLIFSSAAVLTIASSSGEEVLYTTSSSDLYIKTKKEK